ncbi:MAG: Xaa-Pro peptidase family protein [Lachnospiraceae bacterium]|nr:aminopeptidase P family protein [Lachnospiraceae bacterium]MEE1014513.1 Xaa-Pro peptidase family protein [Lachnospiraceae bacterium]
MRPTIRQEEFLARGQKVQNLMEEKGLDLIIAYADDRFVYGQAYARWLLNYQPAFEPAFVMVPAKGDAVIATGAESVDFVHNFSNCKKAYAVWEFLHPDEEYPYCEVVNMKDVNEDLETTMGRKIEKVGIAGASAVPYHMMLKLQEIYGAENIIDVDEEMSMLRAVKSENEIEVIRYAYKIAQAGMDKVAEIIRPGMTEREIAAEAEYVMRKMGSEGMGIDTMVASGKDHTMPILARITDREVKDGDLVVVTLAPRYQGYHGAVARPFFIGKQSDTIMNVFELVKQAQEQTAAKLRPGVTAKEVDETSREVLNNAGIGNHFVYTGVHSTGVIEFEAPILASKSDVVIEKNMVYSIDIPIFITEWGGMRLENGYLITENGPEPLNDLDTSYCIK